MSYWKSQWTAIESKKVSVHEVVADFLNKTDHWESSVPAKKEVVDFVSTAVEAILNSSVTEAMTTCLTGN